MDRYLVIDDEPMIHALMRRTLGPEVSYGEAHDGVEGLRMARETLPDMILLDVSMPEVDGRDVLRAIRKDESLCGTPVVMITGNADPLHRMQALQAGADEVIEKPFDPMMLRRRLGWMLEKRRQIAA